MQKTHPNNIFRPDNGPSASTTLHVLQGDWSLQGLTRVLVLQGLTRVLEILKKTKYKKVQHYNNTERDWQDL